MDEDVYTRRCDECRAPYLHTKGAMTGWCDGCQERIVEHSLSVPPVTHDHFHLPVIEPLPGAAPIFD
jgi:hypothetical protein